jgi:FkbM family methyltransferase
MLRHWFKNFYRRQQLRRVGITVDCTATTHTAGARSGTWTVCPDLLSADSVVYSFGVGNNISWDLELIERFGVDVHAFDPTPASVEWVTRQKLPRGFHFHPIGVSDHDGLSRFALPHGRGFNYQTAVDGTVTASVRRVSTLMKQLGHARIDLLKIDIEGAEYPVLADLLSEPIFVGQLLVEFHHHFPTVGLERTVAVVNRLRSAGYRIFHISDRGLEVAFLGPSSVASLRRSA